MTQETYTPQMYRAWRYGPSRHSACMYVETVAKHGAPGDRYSYTSDVSRAAALTERQCKAFCSYMRDCATVGFWGMC